MRSDPLAPPDAVTTTVDRELRWAEARLADAGVESPRWDAEQLAAHVLGVRRVDLVQLSEMTGDAHAAFIGLVGRRAERVPLQHLTGTVGFRYIDLEVGPGVFIPRPETEVVVGYAIDHLRSVGIPAPLVVELCAGSAAIALSVAHEVPGAVVHAVEVDAGALEWAARNADARALAGDPRVQLHHASVEGALSELDGTVDCVVANPPYVAVDEMDDVHPEVRDHDPTTALVAGPDGLDVIREVVARSAGLLRPGGLLVVEHSDRQGESAPAVLHADGRWIDIADREDLTGRPRYLTARRAPS
ncbi:MAG TPA: peptide chain release factor N(5)-glutamine methyltransferase [Mycobacteriales bacterium]|nr:peptide chain release factor N(5)-glutamine methyltransferase [Mycobacteriales bacterium]